MPSFLSSARARALLARTLPLGRVLGIPLRVHWSWFLLVLLLTGFGWHLAGPLALALMPGLAVLSSLAVALHELGHAMAARAEGVGTQAITLTAVGGVASMDYMPEDPGAETRIAAAGPLVSGLLALSAYALVRAMGWSWNLPATITPDQVPEVATLCWVMVNTSLLLFNLLPAFPLDGGRLLRATLARRYGHSRATRLAGRLGQVLGVAMTFAGIGYLHSPTVPLIGLMVFQMAGTEVQTSRLRALLDTVPLARLVDPSPGAEAGLQLLPPLPSSAWLWRAVQDAGDRGVLVAYQAPQDAAGTLRVGHLSLAGLRRAADVFEA